MMCGEDVYRRDDLRKSQKGHLERMAFSIQDFVRTLVYREIKTCFILSPIKRRLNTLFYTYMQRSLFASLNVSSLRLEVLSVRHCQFPIFLGIGVLNRWHKRICSTKFHVTKHALILSCHLCK